MAIATAMSTDSTPADSKPRDHSAARISQARGPRRGWPPVFGLPEASVLEWVAIESFVRSRQHYKNCDFSRRQSDKRVLLPLHVLPLPCGCTVLAIKSKASAFGNARNPDNWEKPLRDKELTDSIEVIS